MRNLFFLLILLSSLASAQSTKLWTQSKFDEFEKGTTRGVAILNSGRLELAPAFRQIYTSPSTYLWSIASDAQGNAYVAAGAPARIYRVQPDGRASVILAPNELQVQALVVDPAGVIYAATSPDGKVYKIERKPGAQQPAPAAPTQATGTTPVAPSSQAEETRVALDPNYTTSVFFEPKTKYIWALALDRENRLYVATGDRGEIFRVERNGASSTFFKSDEAHIRALAFDNTGNLIAGSDGSGLVYRIAPTGDAFVLYGAAKKEVTALAVDKDGNIYAAAAGDRRAPAPATTAPVVTPAPAPVATTATGQTPTVTVSPLPQGISVIPVPLTGATGGSEVYRIAPDGSPKRIWSSRDDLVYSLVLDNNGRLLAGTGNKGKIYSISPNGAFTDLLKASANQVIGFARGPQGSLYAATGNLGKVFLIEDAVQREATYESDVFDARIFSRWGRAEVLSRGNIELFARSGNVDNPDRNWSPWRKIDLAKEANTDAPPARFIQWRAILHSGNPGPSVDSVSINYQPKNVAPEIDDVTVAVGSRYQSAARPSGDSNTQPTPTPNPTRDEDYVAVRWTARDDNDDSLLSSVYYRGDNESNWKLLKSDIADRFYSFESALLPDGGYTIKVITTDAPSHSPDDALSAERESARFEIDSTPPQVQNLAAVYEGSQLHVTFVAADSSTPIRRAEYSLNAADWQVIDPVGQLSDSKLENYDLYLPLPVVPGAEQSDNAQQAPAKQRRGKPPVPPVNNPNEQVIVVRAYDRAGNMGSAKLVVRPQAPPK